LADFPNAKPDPKKPSYVAYPKEKRTIFNDFRQNKGEIVHDNMKIAAKFHL